MEGQCDQIDSSCFQFWPFTTMKLCPIVHIILPKLVKKFAQVASKFCPKLIRPHKNCQSILKASQSGEISPNLVTLLRAKELSKMKKKVIK